MSRIVDMPPTTAKDMLASLLRSKPAARRGDSHHSHPVGSHPPQTSSPGPASRHLPDRRHATADFTEGEDDDDEEDDGNEFDPNHPSIRFADQGVSRRNPNPIIPLFSASHLDTLPVYSVVHAIRIIVQARTETSLSWEQLRSPQVSQFLVKPMQQQIRTQHFNRATLYALMANCLQFGKEAQLYPGNAAVSITRARVCELLALKLLKEYSTRELIDALSYDFDPLQGSVRAVPTPKGRVPDSRGRTTFARSSTLEVAILASAKHFVSHPLVVQQLEAIWNGAITFYSSNDTLHRAQTGSPGATGSDPIDGVDARTPLLGRQLHKEQTSQLPVHEIPVRRTVALYDPRNASPLKLSRLRVPRYRYFLSTCSLFMMICLFLAVLNQRSNSITSLELLFWFWSTGFMLDGVVGFNEKGFSLYIMSYWNIVDLGILLLLIIYYGMRLCGVFLVNSVKWNDMAYEVLAANAILLLPRIFSVLDHYPYFSQLLIAFRFMAEDLMALFVVILISCSGFFVFFTLSKNENNGIDVAYQIFQILMGYTPAAWDVWPSYTVVERLLLIFFLIICHFLIATILITVLTNSFTAIASNAKEEHQFLFAINTISMVKNDALFSYIAPANILAWVLIPLRYVMPIKQFVVLNRTVIKLTHWPILFLIFMYEKYYLALSIYEPTDLVEGSGPRKGRRLSLSGATSRSGLFSPTVRTREESIAGFQKDQALDEVFRRHPDVNTIRTQRRQERRKTQTAIRNWMDQSDEIGESLSRWPTIESRPSLSLRRMSMSRDMPRRFRTLSDVRSAASDPADLVSNNGFSQGISGLDTRAAAREPKDFTDGDGDGDDELVTNDDEYDDEVAGESRQDDTSHADQEEDYFTTPMASRRQSVVLLSTNPTNQPIDATMSSVRSATRRQGLHSRTLSTSTILYNPQEAGRHESNSSSMSEEMVGTQPRPRTSRPITAIEQSTLAGPRSPRQVTQHAVENPARPRGIPKSALHRTALLGLDTRRRQRKLPSDNSDITGALAETKHQLGAVPASFATQMAMATGQLRGLQRTSSVERERENSNRMSRLVLARMKTLEESFADVAREVQLMRSAVPTAQNSADEASSIANSQTTNTEPLVQTRSPRAVYGRRKNRPWSAIEERLGMEVVPTREEQMSKGKGKETMRSDNVDAEDRRGRMFARRGSSL
ncbi:putative integral membrane channel protein [Rosellinia necatrix]|uniref:Putative integral membrane channel protein n=1 Tax=Rosellinia necatrix TaxID=77044 RepID=A0A1W2TFL7_ROSNE|nr:putative integral membrane channel protein [Rosellinia necatrix]